MKIFIADDSRVMLAIVTRTRRQAGYEGHDRIQAADGSEALDLVNEQDPDLVLSDWNMPQMNSIDLLNRLRIDGNSVPSGFVTSEGSPQVRLLAESAGALFLFAKPFTAEAFRNALERVLGCGQR